MESRTYQLILVKTEDWSFAPKKEKYNRKDKVMIIEFRSVLPDEKDKRF